MLISKGQSINKRCPTIRSSPKKRFILKGQSLNKRCPTMRSLTKKRFVLKGQLVNDEPSMRMNLKPNMLSDSKVF
jgi:hypothetical protein